MMLEKDESYGNLASDKGLTSTPLHFAAYYSSVQGVVDALNYGWDVNQAAERGATPLHFAISRADIKDPSVGQAAATIVATLLSAGADANSILETSDTALLLATRNGDESIVSMLLAAGAEQPGG